ncbi:MAG: glycosyltransferase family 39 protein, partial [Anaerolineae bacterium]
MAASTHPSSPGRRIPWEHSLALAAIILAGFCLRIGRLGAQSIWYDEGVSLYLAGLDIPAMIRHTAGDIHPPLYYALLHLWIKLAGKGEFAANFLSLIFGLMLIPMVYRAARALGFPRAGLWAALLTAISPYHIWYAQEARMYTVGAWLGLVSAGGLWLALKSPRRRRLGWMAYTSSAAVGLYTLYYFAFLLIALNIWALAEIWALKRGQRRPAVRGWVLAQAGVLLLYAPWLSVAFRQATNPPVPPWREWTPVGKVLLESLTALSFGQSVEPAQVWPFLIVVVALVLAGAWSVAQRNGRHLLLAAGYFLIPLTLIELLSIWSPLYHVRYMFTYAPAFAVLLGIGMDEAGRKWRPAPWIAGILLALVSTFSLAQYHFDPRYAPDDHRSAVHFLEEHWRPGDAVLVNAGYAYPTLLYYLDLPAAWRGRLSGYGVTFRRSDAPQGLVLVQTGTVDGPPSLGWGDPRSDFYAISQQETDRALARLFQDYERVWVYRIYDTVTDPQGHIRVWLETHGRKFEETPAFAGLSNMRVQGYLTHPEPAGMPASAVPVGTLLGGRLELAGAEATASQIHGGVPLDIVLWWRPREAGLPRLAVTARLVDDAGVVWAQSDEQPLGTLYFSDQWPAGAVVRHPVRLHPPLGLPPGTYRLMVGVYEAESGASWPASDSAGFAMAAAFTALGDEAPRSIRPRTVFGGCVGLLEAELAEHQVEAGRYLHLATTWGTLQSPAEDLVLFVQLLDGRGRLVAAQEGPPADGRFPTSQWAGGQAVRDMRSLHVPADT